jgi:AsmA protein
MKWLKGIFTLIIVLLLVIVAAATFLLIGIDPNSYKPELEKLAKENNIELSIDGDLGWSFFPNLAVEAGSTMLSGKEAGIPDIQFARADFILDWKALLSRTVRLRAINIDGADIKIETAAEAATVVSLPATLPAAESSTRAQTQPQIQSQTQAQESSTVELPFELAIDEFNLTNGRITIVTEGGTDQVLEQLNFTSNGLNLDGQPFTIDLNLSTKLPEQPSPISIEFQSKPTFQLDTQIAELADSTLKITGLEQLPITLSFNSLYQGKESALSLANLTGKVGPADVAGEINAIGLDTSPSATGKLSIQNLLLNELPLEESTKQSLPKDFNKVSIETEFSASETLIKLDQLALALGKFNIEGNAFLKLEGQRELELTLKGNDLKLPTSNTENNEAANGKEALLTPILAPLLLLDGGKGHIELTLDSVTSDNIKIDQFHLNLFANGSVLQITDLSGGIFDGKFQATTKVDLRDLHHKNKVPKVKFSKQLTDIDIYKALTTLAEQSDVHGKLTMDFSGTTLGDTQEALMANVKGNGKLSANNLQIDNINVERSYCEMAALIEKVAVKSTWPNSTQLKDMQSDIIWKNQMVTFPNLTTGMGNLAISGNGTVDLNQEIYNMLITANLQGDSTSDTGCHVKSKSIRNRDIPLRCTGSFAENGEGSCLPDKQFINQLLQDKIKEKLFDKFLEPKEDSASNSDESNTEEADTNEPKDIKEQVIDSLLKGIFQ